ncbi:hypothetical protein [Candidatus Hecatella orcuttiae]|uniref:hypothetical protein n=1 Tax=Candidatus Hecatella orcuttiae TaxID=1935119 RepID=UPI002867E6AF|nr:hypothetical protein [Candidatus Hecatella orcuttiae]
MKKWERFGRALRKEDRELFQDMVNACRFYASAAGAATRPVITEALLMSILLSHHIMLKDLRVKLDELLKCGIDQKG